MKSKIILFFLLVFTPFIYAQKDSLNLGEQLVKKPKIKKEILPLASYEVDGVQKIVLTNYRSFYSSEYFVRSGGNPILARGQKRFIQACLGCHSSSTAEFVSKAQSLGATQKNSESRELASISHPTSEGLPVFDFLDQAALGAYIERLVLDKSQKDPASVKRDTAAHHSDSSSVAGQ